MHKTFWNTPLHSLGCAPLATHCSCQQLSKCKDEDPHPLLHFHLNDPNSNLSCALGGGRGKTGVGGGWRGGGVGGLGWGGE